jgi:hypothetical protein
MRAVIFLVLGGWSALALGQSVPLGPGKPGQKKLPPASQPVSQPTSKPVEVKPKPIETAPKATEVKNPPTTKETTPASAEAPASTSLKAEKPKEKAERPQVWMRAAGEGAQFLPGAAGGAVDLFALRSFVRAGTRLEVFRFEGATASESLLLGAGVLGLAYPGKVTPFVEAYAGGGYWRQDLFGQNLFSKSRMFGLEAGAEVYVSDIFFLFGAAGYREILRDIEGFNGPETESFGGGSFRIGAGVAKASSTKRR